VLARKFACVVVSLVTVGVCATVIAAAVPVWPLELFEHFRVQFSVLGILAIGGTIALRLRGYFDAAVIATLVHICSLLPDAPTATVPAHGTPVRVLVLNVLTSSTNHDAVRTLIADTRPDVIGLVEVDQRWLDALAPVLAEYAGRIEAPRNDNFGLALYTRGPMTGGIEYFDSIRPSIVAELGTVSAVLIHPLPPVSASASAALDTEFAAVAARARTLRNVLVIGDFNTSPWSRAFRRLLSSSGLCDSRDGFGIQPTFPSSLSLARIPIDHLLHACTIGVTNRRIERDVGSDHLPVVVDLMIP
jgi:endonuclease/exonuclease/phosphatase (EEP) superfamily protein YafD